MVNLKPDFNSIKFVFVTTLILTYSLSASVIALAGTELVVVEGEAIQLSKAIEGEIKQGSFTMMNKGDTNLRIYNFLATCSCLTIKNRGIHDIKPGESVTVNFTFDTQNFGGGKTTKEVMIFTNASGNPYRLRVSVRVDDKKTYHTLVEEVKSRMFVIVDVRSQMEYTKQHVLGAVNVPANELADWLKNIPPEIPVLLYSNSGKLGDKLTKKLSDPVNKNLTNLVGGLEQWKLLSPELIVSGPPYE